MRSYPLARPGPTVGLLVLAGLALIAPGDCSQRGLTTGGRELASIPPGGRVSARVERVIDGDTIEVSIGGATEQVRYIGVDTPESVDPDRPAQCFGSEASAFNERLVEGADVELAFDAERRDAYGRLLAYVYLDGGLVNAILARRGLARPLTIEPNDSKAGLFERLAAAAARRPGAFGRRAPHTRKPPGRGATFRSPA